MTYFYTCPHCGASLKIETDQAAMAIQHIKDYEKKHKCKRKKHEPIQQVQHSSEI